MTNTSSGLPSANGEWQRTNDNAYERLWRGQRSVLGASGSGQFAEWFELNWKITNRYWVDFLNRHATGRRILECGGATGRLPLLLARQGWQCTLVDITTEGPLLARERFERGHQRGGFVTGDVLHLPFADQSFDVVYSNGLLDVLPDIKAATREMTRVLRPGGLFVAAANPRRLSVQTLTERSLSLVRKARRLLRRNPDRAYPSTPTAAPVFRNDYSLEAYLAACKEAGLQDIRGHGVGLLPVVALPGSLMRRYVQLARMLAPLHLRFNWSESAWTAGWGVMLAFYGHRSGTSTRPSPERASAVPLSSS
jgi:ubiquinone/menaquinone biosynthesis C-methylase UbiE